MKKLINLMLIAIASLAVACHKDAAYTTLQPVKFNPDGITASTNSITLSANTDATDVLKLTWTAAVYPSKKAVKYKVQIDVATDTASWANAQSDSIGTDVLTATFTGAQVNSWALALGIPANETGNLIFRVQAFSDRFVYSKPVVVAVTTYMHLFVAPPAQPSLGFPVLYVPGDYQGWAPATAPTLAAPTAGIYKTGSGDLYEGFVYVPAGGTDEYKFTNAPDFTDIAYGDSGTPNLLSASGGNLKFPGPGFYEVSVNTTTLAYNLTPEAWAIIGDATPNGWDTETPMTYDPAYHAWKVTLNLIHNGSFKFRANNAWHIDFGILSSTGQIYFADNPILGGDGAKGGLDNMTVPEDGNYTIYLDLSDPNTYRYYLDKH
jgi:hypothetical protein